MSVTKRYYFSRLQTLLDSTFKWNNRNKVGNIAILVFWRDREKLHSTPIFVQSKQEVEFMYEPWVEQYMLNDLLSNTGIYIKGYSVCVRPFCVLEYRDA